MLTLLLVQSQKDNKIVHCCINEQYTILFLCTIHFEMVNFIQYNLHIVCVGIETILRYKVGIWHQVLTNLDLFYGTVRCIVKYQTCLNQSALDIT